MIFKENKLKAEYATINCLLQQMVEHFCLHSWKIAGVSAIIVRVLETIQGSSGVHEDGRAVDFRDEHNGVFLYTERQREELVETINSLYPRRDGKPTLLWHSFNGGPHHFHLQLAKEIEIYGPRVS